ncbi:MAG: aminoacyl--tRNA ligase-related protein [Candidatus Paceibacterota bacterium]
MRQSQLFSKTRKNAPADEVAKNAQLLIQAGFIHKEMAGVYAYLPLGLRVRNKIEEIIREEMNAVGGQEVELTALQREELWQRTDRWSDESIDVWFKTKLKNDTEVGLATTHEEPLTELLTQHINSYRDMPLAVYQFQTKFRNELRSKSGIMRGREFLMKDLYSFCRTQDEHDDFYAEMKSAYERVFRRVGIGEDTFYTYADGGSFSDYSHEFQTVSDAGEDTIYIDDDSGIAINKEMLNESTLKELDVEREDLREARAIEVGNIFPLGTKFSDALGLVFKNEDGEEKPVIMGSYGIGVGRLMGTIVEIMAAEDGFIWPENIAPFRVHLLALGGSDDVRQAADGAYEALQSSGIEVLYDDRDASPGEKFGDSDLIGIPTQIVIGNQTINKDGVEVTNRLDKDSTSEILPLSEVINSLS